MKVLILKPSSLGDVIHALPVLRLLKRHLPDSEIFWWLDVGLLPLLENDPDLAGVVAFHRQKWSSPRYWPEAVKSIGWVRRQHFDWVIDLQGLARSGAFAWLSNAGLTIGVDDPREGAGGFYDLRVSRPSALTHAVDWYLAVVKTLGVTVDDNFTWLPRRAEASDSIRRKWPIDAHRWILINPGARWWNKRWPPEYYFQLVYLLAQDYPNHRFAVLGGLDDVEFGKQIAANRPDRCVDLTGQTSLPEMVEWVRAGDIMVTNDTGPMHVAAALRRPVVAMFGPTEPRRTGPYGQIDRALQIELPCVPCLKAHCTYEKPMECLRGISPQRVREEIHLRMPH